MVLEPWLLHRRLPIRLTRGSTARLSLVRTSGLLTRIGSGCVKDASPATAYPPRLEMQFPLRTRTSVTSVRFASALLTVPFAVMEADRVRVDLRPVKVLGVVAAVGVELVARRGGREGRFHPTLEL